MEAQHPDRFYKYVPASTALLVLRNQTIRWSSPALFNDPFDVPRELVFGATPEDIHAHCANILVSLITDPATDKAEFQPKIRMILEALDHRETTDLKAELIAGIRDLQRGFASTGESLDALRAQWRSLIPDYRILCLTDTPLSMSMWYHYAEKYAGVVYELTCNEAVDSAWLAARPVSYPLNVPDIYSAAGWARLLFKENRNAVITLLDTAAFTKSPDWSYEREWRIASFKRPTDEGLYTDYRYSPEELTGLYLGPLISAQDRQEILSAVQRYPNVRSYSVAIGLNREFILTEIDG